MRKSATPRKLCFSPQMGDNSSEKMSIGKDIMCLRRRGYTLSVKMLSGFPVGLFSCLSPGTNPALRVCAGLGAHHCCSTLWVLLPGLCFGSPSMKHTWSLRLQEDAFLGDDLHHFLQCWKKGNTALIGGV